MSQTAGTFGTRLAQLRQEAGLSQQALADQLSVTRQAVSNWERNQTLPDLEMLRAIAQALGTDLNTLCGSAALKPRRKFSKRTGVLCGVLCLCVAIAAGATLAGPESTAIQPTLAPHKIRYTTPDGTSVVAPADGWEELKAELADLPDDEPRSVEPTAALRDTLCYFAKQYELRFAPDWSRDTGTFSSWDEVLFWLYKVGISRGGIMTTEQVDDALNSLFGAKLDYEHQSSRHFRLTEEGYYPLDVVSNSGGSYTLESFSSPEHGVYEAVLREERKTAIQLTLVQEDETIHLRSIVRADSE